MPASKKPDLIPTEMVPEPQRSKTKGDWTISFDHEEVEDTPAKPATPQVEDGDVTRPAVARPLAGRRTPPVTGRNASGGAASGGAASGGAAARANAPTRPAASARTAAIASANAESKQVRLLPGRRVPGTRYRLVRWLGEGGMGVVYEAEHEDIERRVALKILRPEASEDPQQAAQFREEARAASRIGSPNIVEIFDFGELPDGRLMFAMELLNGHGLDGELDKCPMDQARMIGILRQVCKGLAAAHEVGIIHRDVKPDNIILVNHNGRGDWVKVVDFGIATVHAEADAGAAGTPHYMAPEQVLGQAFDGRLDMYSLGCTAYELLVGKPPFVAPTIDEILEHQLTKPPTPPSQQCPPDSVHPALEAVILRCLEKDPNKRFRDMRDLEAALCEAQIAAGLRTAYDDLPLPEVDPDRLDKLRRDMPQPGVVAPRRRWLWPAIAAASTLSATGLALTLWMMRPEPAPEEQVMVDGLVDQARAAGARAHWVYPPADELDETSLIKIHKLEHLEGSADALGDQRAAELRKEFADTLVRLGDQYWEMEGGKPFARDFYMQATMFDDTNAHARERSGVTMGFISDLRDRAVTAQFSQGELRNNDVLIALAEKDSDKRDQKLMEFAERDDTTSLALARSAETLVRSSGKAPAKRPRPRPADEPRADPTPTPAGPNPTATDPATDPAVKPLTTSTAPTPTIKRDTKQSQKLVKDAKAALAAGRRKDAESLYHQALAADNRNATALIGLSDLEFDKGAHQRAADYAEKAVAAAPKTGAYHLKLGDAYYKLLRYTDARASYLKAKEFGVREADERLDKLKSKLGK